MEIDKSKIARAWIEASTDLGLKVITPFSIELHDNEAREFIALIEDFGSSKGTLVCLPEEWDDLGYACLAEEHEYYCSGLYKTYEHYKRESFIETLVDWGWFGDHERKPSWLENEI